MLGKYREQPGAEDFAEGAAALQGEVATIQAGFTKATESAESRSRTLHEAELRRRLEAARSAGDTEEANRYELLLKGQQ